MPNDSFSCTWAPSGTLNLCASPTTCSLFILTVCCQHVQSGDLVSVRAWHSVILNSELCQDYNWGCGEHLFMRRVKCSPGFHEPAFISTSFDWRGKQFLKEDKNGAHCIVTAANKNSLRRSHCVNVGRLVRSLTLSLSLSLPPNKRDWHSSYTPICWFLPLPPCSFKDLCQ